MCGGDRAEPQTLCKLWQAQSKLGIFTRIAKAKVDVVCFQGHGLEKEFPAPIESSSPTVTIIEGGSWCLPRVSLLIQVHLLVRKGGS